MIVMRKTFGNDFEVDDMCMTLIEKELEFERSIFNGSLIIDVYPRNNKEKNYVFILGFKEV